MKLTDYLEDKIQINGNMYDLDYTFDNVLRVYDLREAEEIHNHDKIDIMFNNLIIDCKEELTLQQKSKTIGHILDALMEQDKIAEQAQDEETTDDTPQPTTHDFTQDAELIYASFLCDYQLDLYEQQGVLHWKKFIALLNNLSDDSAFKKVVHVRIKPIPKATKYNAEEIKNLRKMKRLYSLDKERESQVESVNKTFDALGSMFKKSAK